jgi:recombination protein RecA
MTRFDPKPDAKPTIGKIPEKKGRIEGGNYYRPHNIMFIPTGCTLVDCIVGGGWPFGRVVNIVGDKSVGKTLFAIEAAANCVKTFPKAKLWYRDAEGAFDVDYAASIGMPVGRVDFGKKGIDTQWDTIEDIFEDLKTVLDDAEQDSEWVGGLYIVDSLDALSSRAALKRKVDEGSFGLEKVKILTQMFNQLCRRLKQARICLVLISQVREKIGMVMPGDKYTRTGGKALGHNVGVEVWLAQIGQEKKTIKGVERVVGTYVRAHCKKNKVGGAPFRKCDFLLRFGFGVDDLETNLNWLVEVGKVDLLLDVAKAGSAKVVDSVVRKYITTVDALEPKAYVAELEKVRKVVLDNWETVESSFLPRHSKYGVMADA